MVDSQASDVPLACEEFVRVHTACGEARLTKEKIFQPEPIMQVGFAWFWMICIVSGVEVPGFLPFDTLVSMPRFSEWLRGQRPFHRTRGNRRNPPSGQRTLAPCTGG